MLSYFFRVSGIAVNGMGVALLWLGTALALPGLMLASCGSGLERGAYRLWAKQDFSGPNPRGWRWAGFWK